MPLFWCGAPLSFPCYFFHIISVIPVLSKREALLHLSQHAANFLDGEAPSELLCCLRWSSACLVFILCAPSYKCKVMLSCITARVWCFEFLFFFSPSAYYFLFYLETKLWYYLFCVCPCKSLPAFFSWFMRHSVEPKTIESLLQFFQLQQQAEYKKHHVYLPKHVQHKDKNERTNVTDHHIVCCLIWSL